MSEEIWSEAQAICLREQARGEDVAERLRAAGAIGDALCASDSALSAQLCADAIRAREAQIIHDVACAWLHYVIRCEGCGVAVREREGVLAAEAARVSARDDERLLLRDVLAAVVRDLDARGSVAPATLDEARRLVAAGVYHGRT